MSLVNINELNYGDIICSCEMTDEFIEKIKKNKNEYISGVYAKGRYAWILESPINAKGHFGIWNYE